MAGGCSCARRSASSTVRCSTCARRSNSPKDSRFECPIDSIVYLADDSEADCALLEISLSDGCAPAPVPLADRRAKDDELVATIGYPAYDDRNRDSALRYYFGDLFGVKRFAPGRIMSRGKGTVLSHDCTTLGGNSGSVLLSLEQKAAVGLHFAGEFGIDNSAVSVETLKQLMTGSLFAVSAAKSSASAGADEAAADGEHPPGHFNDRDGYDPAFLGADSPRVPLPAMDAALEADLARPSDATRARPHELRYTNFGVLYASGRRTPRLTAVNIDGKNSVRIKRGRDKWYYDLRIDRGLQLGRAFYASDRLDRGHMVRREDPNFGPLAQHCCVSPCATNCGDCVSCGSGVGGCDSCGGANPACPMCPMVGTACGRFFGGGTRHVDMIYGVRWAQLNEGISITEDLTATAQSPDPAGTTFDINDSFSSSNEFFGGEVGFIVDWERRRWSLELLSKLAIGNTRQRADFRGVTTISEPGGDTDVFPNRGLLVQPSNAGDYEQDQFSVIPQLGLTGGYQMTQRLRLTVGYSLLYWSRIARPGDLIDLDVNSRADPAARRRQS